jgi:hypothetical protein
MKNHIVPAIITKGQISTKLHHRFDAFDDLFSRLPGLFRITHIKLVQHGTINCLVSIRSGSS